MWAKDISQHSRGQGYFFWTDMYTRHVQDRHACPDSVNHLCGTTPKNTYGKSGVRRRICKDRHYWCSILYFHLFWRKVHSLIYVIMEVSLGSFSCLCFFCSTLGKCILQKSFPYFPLKSTEMFSAPCNNLITKNNCIEKVKGRRILF